MSRIVNPMMKRITERVFLVAACIVALTMQVFTAGPAVAATALPVLWTAGGLDAGSTGAGQAARLAADASGNVAVVSGPSLARDLAVTSYTSNGQFRWRSAVSPSSGTFVGDWVVAAPNGEFAAVGHNVDSHGRPIGSTLVRYASDGTLRWRVDLVALAARLLVDSAGNTYLAFGGQDIQVHKYSANGVLLWTKGATGVFAAMSLALGPDESDVVLTGNVIGGAIWMTAAFDTATGARRWQVTAAEGIATRDVVVDATRVYVTGEGNVGISGFLTVVAYDRATGTRLWRTDRKPSDGTGAAGLRMSKAPDGSLVVAGQAARGFLDWYTVSFEKTGTVRWEAVRDGGLNTDEFPTGVIVLADGTTVVTGQGGPNLPGGYIQGVTVGYGPNGSLLWEAFSRMATAWVVALPNGNVCATGGYDSMVTCWRVTGGVVNQPPAAVVSAVPTSGIAPLAVNFSSAGSSDLDGTIASYSWSFGDGGTSAATNPSHTYAGVGTYTVILTVIDNAGSSDSKSVTITVTASAIVLRSTDITLTATRLYSTVTATGKVTVKDQAGVLVQGTVVSVSWKLPNGTTKSQNALTNSNGVAAFTVKSGRGTYTLKVTDITKTGYAFDAASSVLSWSITK
jgi:PKD repeat protein